MKKMLTTVGIAVLIVSASATSAHAAYDIAYSFQIPSIAVSCPKTNMRNYTGRLRNVSAKCLEKTVQQSGHSKLARGRRKMQATAANTPQQIITVRRQGHPRPSARLLEQAASNRNAGRLVRR
ncbi:hypothetical protein KJ996_05335 [Patescibacteria group bacterium]|nr:hypothetical protein [Patescibacteria group bacterium]